ncbi:MAG TPA: ATP-binding protein [Clostridiales bacterium]|nr:ATP-binding protein [Clostridiales bacterium]
METTDIIELSLPFKPEYVSIARLTSSAVASRIGFDIETVEDIKVAVSEVCTKYIKKGSNCANHYKLIFKVFKDCLEISFDCQDKTLKCIFSQEDDGLAISIINALMDEVKLCSEDENYLLNMSKKLEGKV